MEAIEEPPVLLEVPALVTVPPVPENGIIATAARTLDVSIDEAVEFLMSRPAQLQHTLGGQLLTLRSIPPHPSAGGYGTPPSDVLVVAKCPNAEEHEAVRLGSKERGNVWKRVLDQAGVNYANWVLTCACWNHVDPKVATWKDAWWREWQHMLALTINRVQPKHLLLWGADAMRAAYSLVDTKKARGMSFKDVRGAPQEYVPGVQALVATSPANVFADVTAHDDMVRDLQTFSAMATHSTPQEAPCRIYNLDHQATLDQLVDKLIEAGKTTFAIDCEWGGGTWLTGQLRTIQFAWSDHEGAVVILRRAGMAPAFSPSVTAAIAPLTRLFKRPGVSIVGHNLRGDLRWLRQVGLDLTEEFNASGFDTMLAHHLCFEAAEQQLELCALRLLGMPRYDTELRDWVSANSSGDADVENVGYGLIPDNILHPYAAMDAIASFRLAPVIRQTMKKSPGVEELYQRHIHPLNLALDEMESTGVLIDEDRVRVMAAACCRRRDELLAELRAAYKWPDFNPRSVYDVRELLFGWAKTDKKGNPDPQAPAGAITFRMTPIKSTDDTPWEKVMHKKPEEQLRYSPSTDSESVGILAADCPELIPLQRYKVVDQLGKNFLRPPVFDAATGVEIWDGGVGASIDEDGRLRTTFRPTLETGRYATSPNLQNFPSKQEPLLREAFTRYSYIVTRTKNFGTEAEFYDGLSFVPELAGAAHYQDEATAKYTAATQSAEVRRVGSPDPQYQPLRSVLMASPGHVLLEADWNQAELWTMGALARDDDFLHVLAVSDVHSEMVIKMFGTMPMPGVPGKRIGEVSAAEIKKRAGIDPVVKSLRTAAKATVFGIPYGRGAGAILRQVKREGVEDKTQSEVQGWIDAFYQTYPRIWEYFEWAKRSVVNPGFIKNPWGRYRRAGHLGKDDQARAAAEREFMNFTIQSTVADAMTAALVNLWTYKRYVDTAVNYRILMSIHDAVLLEAPFDHVERVVRDVFPACMVHGVEVPDVKLHYTLGDIDVQLRWGVKEQPERLLALGVPRDFCGFKA